MKKIEKQSNTRPKKPIAWISTVVVLIGVIFILSFTKNNSEHAKSFLTRTIKKANKAQKEKDILSLRTHLTPESQEFFDFFIASQVQRGDENLKKAVYRFFNTLDLVEDQEIFKISYRDKDGNQKQFYIRTIKSEDDYLLEIDESFLF